MNSKIAPIELEQATVMEDQPVEKKQDKEWANPIEFLMTCISMTCIF